MAIFSKFKQFKAMQQQAKSLQSALAEEKVEVNGEGGKIKLTIDGNQKVTALAIDPELLTPAGKDRIERTLKDLFNDAVGRAQRKMAERVKEMGGLKDMLGKMQG